MAKTPTKAQVNVRLPIDLIEWIATQAGSQTDVITAALTNLRDGPVIIDGGERIAELEQALADQKALTAKWQKAAQAVMPMADRKPEKASGKLVADVLPVAGDQFPEQETWWQKQQLANAGKARKAG